MTNFALYGTSPRRPDISTSRPFSYFVTVPPVGQIMTLDQLKAALNITTDDDDALLTIYLDAATQYAENFTRRDYLARTYETFRDYFDYSNQWCYPVTNYRNDNFLLTKSTVNSIVSFEYTVSGVLTPVDSSLWYLTRDQDFSRIVLVDEMDWPTDGDNRLQGIKIVFTAGISPAPNDIIVAIQQIVADMYANRGDCNCDQKSMGSYVTGAARGILLQNRIERL